MKIRLSKISALHYFKLVYRSSLFVLAAGLYLVSRIGHSALPFGELGQSRVILSLIWLSFFVEMILRFFPSDLESMGCQKQFKKNFIPTKETTPIRPSWKATFGIVAFWLILNGAIGLLHTIHFIDDGILLLIALAYSICDMICILFFCPFQTFFLKNKCCGSCRIYNWDYAMMFTPLLFTKGLYRGYGWTLLGISLLLLLKWEVQLRIHPERFFENTNEALSCKNCPEKLCQHKKHLRRFWEANLQKIYANPLLKSKKFAHLLHKDEER